MNNLVNIRIPQVGTSDFRNLDFKQQLEIKALELFNNDEYLHRTGERGSRPFPSLSSSPFSLTKVIPQKSPDLIDLPVCFLRNYWTAYNAAYKQAWYDMSDDPLCEFSINYKFICNIHTFTFPLLSVEPAVYWILEWVRKAFHRMLITLETVVETCKVYIHLANSMSLLKVKQDLADFGTSRNNPDFSNFTKPNTIYFKALFEHRDLEDIDAINAYLPLVEEPYPELDALFTDDLILYARARRLDGRWYYPLVPASLFYSHKFSIKNWGFI